MAAVPGSGPGFAEGTIAPAGEPDGALVARCRLGDEGAWRELVERFSRYVYAITTRAYGLRDRDAEDVFQDVFARAFERLDSLRDDSAFRPWLAQLARRLSVDRLRARSREALPAEPELEIPDPRDALSEIEDAMTVRVALASLAEECQQVLDRFFSQDQSYRTIGETLGIPQGTIASRISRCLMKLREQLLAGGQLEELL